MIDRAGSRSFEQCLNNKIVTLLFKQCFDVIKNGILAKIVFNLMSENKEKF
jgi:hypothetical protein